MKKTIGNLAAVAALVTAASLAPIGASALAAGEDGPSLAVQQIKKVAAELGMTAQQKQGIKAILQNDQEQFQPLLQQLKSEHRNLRALIQADTVDEAAIQAQSAKVAAIQASLAVKRAQMSQEMRKLLTPEQIQKFKDLQAKRDALLDALGVDFWRWLESTN